MERRSDDMRLVRLSMLIGLSSSRGDALARHLQRRSLVEAGDHAVRHRVVRLPIGADLGQEVVVDAAQGIEAQTLANLYLAIEAGLTVIPVINKIDLPAADVEATREAITEVLDLDGTEALAISAKHGTGVPEVLEAIVARIPPPSGIAICRALV